MKNQGISRTRIVLHQEEFIKLVGFPAEEVLGLQVDNPCNDGPLLLLDKRLLHMFVIYE